MSKTKTIKFFISSTFKDFEQERNILNKFVFPKLKALCHEKGFGFQPIDLRWGIKEEAGYDQQTMNICLNEIKRSSSEPKPNLLLLVGQRYGWVPIPYDIVEDEFEDITSSDKLSKEEITLLKDWYLKDENSIPTTYYLKDKSKYKDNRDKWNDIENTIRKSLQKVSNNPMYHTSATEQEMYAGLDAFDKSVDHEHTFAYFRTITDYEKADKKVVEDFIDKDLSKLKTLSKKLQNDVNIPADNQSKFDNIHWKSIEEAKNIKYDELDLDTAPDYIKKFHDDILEKFETSIKKEIENFEESTKLQIELEEQEKFLDKRSEVVLGRDTEVENIKYFFEDKTQQYYLQYGKSGTGKTSVMSKSISSVDKQKYEVIYRFVGTTANSTYSRQLFENIYLEIESKIQNDKKLPTPSFEQEDHKFKDQFREKLKEYQEVLKKPIVIFLDAVDQFEDQNNLTILLEGLPKEVKVVFSCLYDEDKKENEDYYWYYERLNYLENENSKLKPLSNQEKSNQDILIDILEQWLKNINRQITLVQKEFLKNKVFKKNSTPLFARLVYEIVKHWKHEETDLELKTDEKGLIYQFFDFIVKKYHHEDTLLNETLGLISASKDGLSEEELLDLFSRDKNVLEIYQDPKGRYPKLDRLPNAIWSRFYYYIEDIFTEKLIDGEMLISPYHRIIEEAIKERYYNISFHNKLANYFYTLQDETKTWDERYNNLHMLSELPYQLFKSKKYPRVLKNKILVDLEFAGSVYDNHKQNSFRDIMEKASELKSITEDEIYPWESFYREKEHLITKVDEELWKPHQSLFQLAYEDGNSSPLTLQAEDLIKKNKIDFHWLKNISRPEAYTRSGLLKVLDGHSDFVKGTLELKDGRILSYSGDNTLRLWASDGEPLIVLEGHTHNVSSAIELKGGRILSCSGDETLMLWDNDGKSFSVLEGHSDTVIGALELKDGRILSYSGDNTLRLWTSDGEPLSVLEGHTHNVSGALELNGGKILSYSVDNTLRLWNSDGKFLNILEGHTYYVNGALELQDGRILSYSQDNTLRLWDTNGEFLNILEGHNGHINSSLELKDGRILSSSWDETLRLWTSDGDPLSVLEGHEDSVEGALELKDGRILSYSWDETLRLWTSDGQAVSTLEGHSSVVRNALELKNGRILSYSGDNTLRLWTSNGEPLSVLEGHSDDINGILELEDGKILSYSEDKNLRLWDTNGKFINGLEGHTHYVNGALKLNTGRILSYSWDNTLRLWASDGEPLSILEGHSDDINGFLELEDGRILSYSCDGALRLWNENGKCLSVLEGHRRSVQGVLELKNGKILSYSLDSLRLWNRYGKFLTILEGHIGDINGALELEDGRIVSYSSDETLRLWENDGKFLDVIEGHTQHIIAVLELKDGRILSTSFNTLRLCNSNGKPLNVLEGHTDLINGVIELQDRRILSYSKDKTLRLWNSKGDILKVLGGHTSSIIGAIELKDGRILSYSGDGTSRLWNSDGDPLTVLEGHTDLILSVIELKDGRILSYSKDSSFRLWDKDGKLLNIWYISVEGVDIHQIKEKSFIASNGKYLLLKEFCYGKELINNE